jgi:VanZ family protein
MSKLIILLFLFPSLACAQIPKDKQLHLVAGTTIGSWCFLVGDHNQRSEWKPIIYGISGATLAGVAKESYDRLQGRPFDVRDLGATMIGGIISVVIIETTRTIINRHRRHLFK